MARAIAWRAQLVPSPDVFSRLKPYYELTRPRVLALVLLTAPPVYFADSAPAPRAWHTLVVLAAIWLLGGACSAFNAYLERDSDKLMARTRDRPLPSGRLAPRAALCFAFATAAVSLALLFVFGSALAAALGLATLVHYVVIYTWLLKRRSSWNIVIGGAAGAAAPLIADAALDGNLRPLSLFLFGIICLWTPAHFWSIALYRKAEYAAAKIPMLPAVVGDQATRWRMLAYNVVLLVVSLGPVVSGDLGMTYAILASLSGVAFIAWTIRAVVRADEAGDRSLFVWSLFYLLIVCVAAPLDFVVRQFVGGS